MIYHLEYCNIAVFTTGSFFLIYLFSKRQTQLHFILLIYIAYYSKQFFHVLSFL